MSISANDPNNVSADEEEDEYYGEGRRKVRFDKDDGDGLLFKKLKPKKKNESEVKE